MHRTTIIHNDGSSEYYFREGCFVTEWWNVAEDPLVSIARVRVEPGVTTAWHRLEGVVERYVILEGEGMAGIGDSVPERVGPGSVVVIPAGVPQRIGNFGARDLVFLAVCTPRFRAEIYHEVESAEPAG